MRSRLPCHVPPYGAGERDPRQRRARAGEPHGEADRAQLPRQPTTQANTKAAWLRGRGVEFLHQPVGGSLNLLVSPLGGSVEAGDQAASMKTAEVTVDEREARLGLVGGTI